MNYNDVKSIVREVVWGFLEGYFDSKECPKCKKESTMIRIRVEDPNQDLNTSVGCETKWRCLNCLGIFTQELKSVE